MTFNVGEIIPYYVDEVLPGDTFRVKTSKLIRLQTLITPVMDNIVLDTYYFFVPNRIIWDHWRDFMGENRESAWVPTTEYQVPQISSPTDYMSANNTNPGWGIGSVADYMGIPVVTPTGTINALPFRAYAKICDEWFRDQNLSDPLDIPTGDATITGYNPASADYNNQITSPVRGGAPYKAAKKHDYFTSALPAPQKGEAVTIPGTSGQLVVPSQNEINLNQIPPYATQMAQYTTGVGWTKASGAAGGAMETLTTGAMQRDNSNLTTTPQTLSLAFTNLQTTGEATINELRLAFQMQKLLERDARGGTRYIEILKSHFGVTSPDARQQRSEYLGGSTTPININQVVQTSETANTPQGTTSAFSVTSDSNFEFSKSFTEHGYVIGVCVARYEHTYQEGLNRTWSRKTKYDYYWPALANIGEQAILNKELFLPNANVVPNVDPNGVFGYQEAWAEYRYLPNRTAGEMRSRANSGIAGSGNTLDAWHLGDTYQETPLLSDEWIREDKSNVNRCLAVTSDVSNQILMDIYIMNNAIRPMPMYSIPGMVDHF